MCLNRNAVAIFGMKGEMTIIVIYANIYLDTRILYITRRAFFCLNNLFDKYTFCKPIIHTHKQKKNEHLLSS